MHEFGDDAREHAKYWTSKSDELWPRVDLSNGRQFKVANAMSSDGASLRLVWSSRVLPQKDSLKNMQDPHQRRMALMPSMSGVSLPSCGWTLTPSGNGSVDGALRTCWLISPRRPSRVRWEEASMSRHVDLKLTEW